MYSSNEVICYNYECRRPYKRSMYYNAEKYWKVYKIVSRNWYNYLMRANKNYSILDIAKADFPKVPRTVLSDIVTSISISEGL